MAVRAGIRRRDCGPDPVGLRPRFPPARAPTAADARLAVGTRPTVGIRHAVGIRLATGGANPEGQAPCFDEASLDASRSKPCERAIGPGGGPSRALREAGAAL